ncbi:MAG TPA: 3-deoxy-D-manno-octulosonic acid transferase, partial [Azospirillaceae bacterium]|nr:3-deoxy-D-manno-octulosonic acid transferase [Azospirillaceae bacterium]
MLETLYRGLTHLAAPAIRHWLDRRRRAGKEDASRLPERFGVPGLPRPEGRLVWLHAASVGESLAVLPLVERLAGRGARVLVTTGTVTSATLMARRLPAGAIHQYVPVDLPRAVDRFLDHWRPDLALWIESEFWPNLLRALRRRRVPAALVNARLSAGSHRNWRRAPRTAARLLSAFRLALAQTEAEAFRLRDLGLADVRTVGNLKYSASPLPADAGALAALRGAVAGRPAWVFASSHEGEEEVAAAVHRALAPSHPGLLTVLVPRHPERGDAVAALLAGHGLRVARRSRGEAPDAAADLFLGDTLGELGLFYRLAPVAAVGGSFVPVGGHNPVEPALLDAAVLYGPHMHNFAEMAAELEAAGGALRVADAGALAAAVSRLLADADARGRLAAAGAAVAERNRQAADRVMEALAPLLAEAGIG